MTAWLPAQTHASMAADDPDAIPAWTALWDGGPFRLPAPLPGDVSATALWTQGMKHYAILDDWEAERSFRRLIDRFPESLLGYLGAFLCAESRPGRQLTLAEQAQRAVKGPHTAADAAWTQAMLSVVPPPSPPVPSRASLLSPSTPLDIETRWKHWRAFLHTHTHPEISAATLTIIRLRQKLAGTPPVALSPEDLSLVESTSIKTALRLKESALFPTARQTPESLPPAPHPEIHLWHARALMAHQNVAAAASAAEAAYQAALARHPTESRSAAVRDAAKKLAIHAWVATGAIELYPHAEKLATQFPAMPEVLWEACVESAQWPALLRAGGPAEASVPMIRLRWYWARAIAHAAERQPEALARLRHSFAQLSSVAKRGFAGLKPQDLTWIDTATAELDLWQATLSSPPPPDLPERVRSLPGLSPARRHHLTQALTASGPSRPIATPQPAPIQSLATASSAAPPTESMARLLKGLPPPASDATPTTVLLFFLGHKCTHCLGQMAAFAPHRAKFTQKGARLIGISTDEEANTAKTWPAVLALKPGLLPEGESPFPIVADASLATFKALGLFDEYTQSPLHGVFVLNALGLVIWRHVGSEPFTDAAEVIKGL